MRRVKVFSGCSDGLLVLEMMLGVRADSRAEEERHL
jgi:hypothetical protein